MKKMSWFSLFAVLILFVSPVLAQEGMLVENVSSFQAPSDALAHSFGVIVTSRGKLTIKPGPVFTEGIEEPGTVLPYLLSDPKPIAYPKQAIAQGWQGKIVIAIEVLADGSVGSYQIMNSTGREILDETAVQAVRSWSFHPAVKASGEPFRTCVQIPITFQLQDE